ncbi:MAG: hypothetical protein ACREMN_12555, partial [Gemmatimonadales bacterium]
MQRHSHVVIAGAVVVLAAAEWLRSDALPWAWLAVAAGLAAVGLAVSRPPRRFVVIAAALASLGLGTVLLLAALRVRRIECCWPALREARIIAAS